ncbi:MAG: glycosyltransferase family 1 protein [Microthrixaceae bacterium]
MSETPRVAVTLTQCWHQVPGGTATSVQRLVEALDRTNRVELLGVGPLGDLRRPSTLLNAAPPVAWEPQIAVSRLPVPLPVLYDIWSRTNWPKISQGKGAHARLVDLIHLTVPIRIPQESTPFVATVHDLFPLTHPQMMTARGAKLMRAGLQEIFARSKRVMVPSSCVADACIAAGLAADQVRVVPWGVQAVALDPASVEQVRARYGLPDRYVLFVGTLEPRKNLATLIQAMNELADPDLGLVLVGPAGWGDAFGAQAAASLNNLSFKVWKLGYLPEQDLAALEYGAQAFCFPSLAEGFGLPVLEAMAAGAAVITSSGTATEEVAGDGAVLIDPSSSQELASALRGLLNDPAGTAELRERAVNRSKLFTWQNSAELTLEVYTEVLE